MDAGYEIVLYKHTMVASLVMGPFLLPSDFKVWGPVDRTVYVELDSQKEVWFPYRQRREPIHRFYSRQLHCIQVLCSGGAEDDG